MISQDGLAADVGGLICLASLALIPLVVVIAGAIRYIRRPTTWPERRTCGVTTEAGLLDHKLIYRCEREFGHRGEFHDGPATDGSGARCTWPLYESWPQ